MAWRQPGFWIVAIMGLLVLGSLALPRPIATRAAAGDLGYRDFSYSAPGVSAPSGEKPESKLWFNDGIWWGILFNTTAEEFHIYRLDWGSQTWGDTGTLVDERNNSKADTLWDGTHLYVASSGFIGIYNTNPTSSADAIRVLRYSYDAVARRYTLDARFPVTLTSYGAETVVLAKDTTGMLWVTFAHGAQGGTTAQIYVSHSAGNDTTWVAPYVLPVQGTTVDPDDVSAVIAYNSHLGVMWSNQLNAATGSAMYFAIHNDGDEDTAWVVSPAITGPYQADDHIRLAADSSGEVFAAVKTSHDESPNAPPDAPLIELLVRSPAGSWDRFPFGTVADNHTRPLVVIDDEHRQLYMFATAPAKGGSIYYKQTSLDSISFPAGLGTPFIQNSLAPNISDATSLRTNVNSTTGLLVLASDDTSGFYLHNTLWLDPARPTPTPLPTATPAPPTATPVPRGYATIVLGSDGLQSYWRLGEASGTTATDSKGTVTGRLAKGLTLGARGLLTGDADTAYAFDGASGAVDFGDNYGFGGTQAFSVEFWLNASATPLNGYTKLVWKEDTATVGSRTGWGTYLNDDGTTRSVALERFSGGKWLGGVACSGLALNTSYHVVFTYDGSTARCYLNGSLGASAAGGGSITASTRSLVLGASDTNSGFYTGVLDDVAVYSVALSGAQVQDHYFAGTIAPAKATHTVRLGNWRWYADAASDATLVPLAAENTAPTLTGTQMQDGIIHLRVQAHEVGSVAGVGAIQVQYSQDGSHWATIQNQIPDVDQEGIWFRWADGAAPAGAALTKAALRGTTSLGVYHEVANVAESVAADATQELDLAIRIHWPPPDDRVTFRILYEGMPVGLGPRTAPLQLRTSTASARPNTITYFDDDPANKSTVNELGFGPWSRIFYDGTRWWLFVVQYHTPTKLAYYSWAGPGRPWSAEQSVSFSASGNTTRDAPAFKTIKGTSVVLAVFNPPNGDLRYRRGVVSGAAIKWSAEFDLGVAPGGYAHVAADDGNFWWVGGIDGTTGVWAARSTSPDAGPAGRPGFNRGRPSPIQASFLPMGRVPPAFQP